MLKKEAFHYMKKKLAAVTLFLSSALVATGCDSNEVTYKENDNVLYTIPCLYIHLASYCGCWCNKKE